MSQFSKTRYSLIGMGGTFDHFHAGHEFFLTYAAENGFKLLIGVSTPKMIQNKSFSYTIQPYAARVKQVKDYCDKKGIQYQIIPLDDPYGPTLDRESKVKALCVTKETEQGAEKINNIRLAGGLRPLPTFVANMVLDESGHELHADRIRAGKVSRLGKVYAKILEKGITLTDEQKEALRPPIGKVMTADQLIKLDQKLASRPFELPTCVVGDVSLNYFLSNSLKYNLGIFDGMQEREPSTQTKVQKVTPTLKTTNPAGKIAKSAVAALEQLIPKINPKKLPLHLFVEGEEDLLTAALVLLLPLHSLIYYGQPNQGMVEVLVTEQVKNTVYQSLS